MDRFERRLWLWWFAILTALAAVFALKHGALTPWFVAALPATLLGAFAAVQARRLARGPGGRRLFDVLFAGTAAYVAWTHLYVGGSYPPWDCHFFCAGHSIDDRVQPRCLLACAAYFCATLFVGLLLATAGAGLPLAVARLASRVATFRALLKDEPWRAAPTWSLGSWASRLAVVLAPLLVPFARLIEGPGDSFAASSLSPLALAWEWAFGRPRLEVRPLLLLAPAALAILSVLKGRRTSGVAAAASLFSIGALALGLLEPLVGAGRLPLRLETLLGMHEPNLAAGLTPFLAATCVASVLWWISARLLERAERA